MSGICTKWCDTGDGAMINRYFLLISVLLLFSHAKSFAFIQSTRVVLLPGIAEVQIPLRGSKISQPKTFSESGILLTYHNAEESLKMVVVSEKHMRDMKGFFAKCRRYHTQKKKNRSAKVGKLKVHKASKISRCSFEVLSSNRVNKFTYFYFSEPEIIFLLHSRMERKGNWKENFRTVTAIESSLKRLDGKTKRKND
jgi:hypothetical protein